MPSLFSDSLVPIITGFPFVLFSLALLSHLYKLQQRLIELAATDVLTGLANRRDFLARAAGVDNGVLLLLDIDYFKRVNDTFGHPTGDLCIQAVARRLIELTRKGDIVARVGGEEFAVVLVGADLDAVRLVGERMADGIVISACRLGSSDVTDVLVSISIGAVFIQPDVAVHELLRRADQALYGAKHGGRARLTMFGSAEALVVASGGATAI